MQKRLYDVGWSDDKKRRGLTKKKERKSIDCIIARVGRRSETRSQKTWENGSKGPGPQRKFQSGREDSRRTLRVKLSGRKAA